MENKSIESVIENSSNLTITTAKKTVHSLADYLHIKGLYLIAKLSPSENPLVKPDNLAFIINFLNTSTMMRSYNFWKNLNKEQKETLVRYMTLRDERSMQLASKSTLKAADVYILLSGKAVLSSINKDAPSKKPQNLRMGAVFGPTDVFDSEKENGDLVVSYTATVTGGTVLRIKYADLYRAKYGDKTTEEARGFRMSAEELAVRQVTKAGAVVLTADMNAFLRKYNLLAVLPSDNCCKYIHHGSIGRQMLAQKREHDVLIVLEGSIRVVLEKSIVASPDFMESTRDKHGPEDDGSESDEENMQHGDPVSMTCRREGEPAANFKMRNIPLCLLEQGSVLLLDEEMLQRVVRVPEESTGTETDEHEEVGLPSLPNTQKNMRDTKRDIYLPHLTLQFDKPTTYLSIPLRRIRNALQNESYQTNLVIRGELKAVCSTLAERIERLKPWLASHRVVTTKHRQPRRVAATPLTKRTDSSILNGDIESANSDLIGAFCETAFPTVQSLLSRPSTGTLTGPSSRPTTAESQPALVS